MRAEYEPTESQRGLVESAAAFGLTQAEIAEQLGIDEKTLRKHFRIELKTRGINQEGIEVMSFERTVLVYRRGHSPEEAASY